MVKYDISHLTQPENQIVLGPIQDDEALFLYSLIRVKRIKCILEIGGLNGYSSKNFIKAMEFDNKEYKLFTCDINKVPKINNNHYTIQKDVNNLNKEDILDSKIELLFLDCHTLSQYDMLKKLFKSDNINKDTKKAGYDILCLHTNKDKHSKTFPFRHGLSICQLFEKLV